MMRSAPFIPGSFRSFTDAGEAVAYLQEIYRSNITYLRTMFEHFVDGETPQGRIAAFYPYVAITTDKPTQVDTRLSYGYVSGPGRYTTTITRPDLFQDYLTDQIGQLLLNHGVPVEVGASTTPIPIHYAFQGTKHVEGGLAPERVSLLREVFTLPEIRKVDDSIANGTCALNDGPERPLSLFPAERIDYSLHRLRHYTGTDPADFQKFVIFTNYQFYMDGFIRIAKEMLEQGAGFQIGDETFKYTRLVGPAMMNTSDGQPSMPQMPAYHLIAPNGQGISIVNIGVGPSNARTISDHVAVLRPDAWMMLGHCAGLRKTQKLGDYVLAHAYVRNDHVLDDDLPLWVPLPALAEIQRALETAVGAVTLQQGYALKGVMRTGTVVSTDNRNWEISDYARLAACFSQSRAIALDMESAVIAANGYRLRVPYGTLLCVSDKPLHGEIKLPGMATDFYRKQVGQHLAIGLKAIALMRANGNGALHSRKLRSFAEVAFR